LIRDVIMTSFVTSLDGTQLISAKIV